MQPRLVVFTDLDGTLLDHHSYSWRAALPALERLAANGIPLVLNSSKTAAEIRVLQRAMSLRAPYIAENGAVMVIPAGSLDNSEEEVVHFGVSHQELMCTLLVRRDEGARFRGFSDLSASEVAKLTGLTEEDAERAKQRLGTEPLLWDGTDAELVQFRAALELEGIRLVQGGRFWHAMGTFDKAKGARFLLKRYQERFGNETVISIALGDSPNDQRMLEDADIPVVIRGVNSDQLQFSPARHAMRSLNPGPEGWNACVLNLLVEYGYQ